MKEEIRRNLEESYAVINDKDPNLSTKLLDEAFAMANTPEEEREAALYVRTMLKRGRKRDDVDISSLLADVRDAVSMSYISQRFFGKERSWLSQRLNGSIVNGKPAAFTTEELKMLSDSFKTLGSKMISVSSEIHKSI